MRSFFCKKGKQSAVYPAVAGSSVQAAADPVRRMPEPGQSRPADCASISLPCHSRAGREGGEDVAFSHFSAIHGTHGLADTMTKNYPEIFG